MTPEQQRLILSLVKVPGRPESSTPEEVLQAFGREDGVEFAVELLNDAVEEQDGDEVELSLILSFVFGVSMAQFDALVRLIWGDWHWSHEDAVSALEELNTPRAVDALFHATQWIPSHLAWDESRSLAVKAIWALGKIPGSDANASLTRLLDSQDEILRVEARRQLRKRKVQ
jgi:HEAT repeat protein